MCSRMFGNYFTYIVYKYISESFLTALTTYSPVNQWHSSCDVTNDGCEVVGLVRRRHCDVSVGNPGSRLKQNTKNMANLYPVLD